MAASEKALDLIDPPSWLSKHALIHAHMIGTGHFFSFFRWGKRAIKIQAAFNF